MDGVHDLGGVQGFGPVATDEPEEGFGADWEGRMWGMARAISRDPGWAIDWFRHVRELIDPVDYLSRPYFDQWMQTYGAMLVDSGHATVQELAAGKAERPGPELGTPMDTAGVTKAKLAARDYRCDDGVQPAFSPGARVVARGHGVRGHTRLPGYVMGRPGVIEAYHGNHVLPDASARGDERAEPLYSVAFRAEDLWPEAAGRRERVFLDLWESYLER